MSEPFQLFLNHGASYPFHSLPFPSINDQVILPYLGQRSYELLQRCEAKRETDPCLLFWACHGRDPRDSWNIHLNHLLWSVKNMLSEQWHDLKWGILHFCCSLGLKDSTFPNPSKNRWMVDWVFAGGWRADYTTLVEILVALVWHLNWGGPWTAKDYWIFPKMDLANSIYICIHLLNFCWDIF